MGPYFHDGSVATLDETVKREFALQVANGESPAARRRRDRRSHRVHPRRAHGRDARTQPPAHRAERPRRARGRLPHPAPIGVGGDDGVASRLLENGPSTRDEAGEEFFKAC
ncbi:MAG: hypothetical protein U0414_41595 [Polyangiaceae bacterium]